MSHFAKVYGTILDSSIWSEDHPTVRLWITMLLMADSTGYIEASLPGLAGRAHITLSECEASLEKFQSPDPYSKNMDHDGRRVVKADRGWQLLNYQEYRDMRTESQVKRAERQARWRAKKAEQERLQVDGVDASVGGGDVQRGEGRGEKGEGKGIASEHGKKGESTTLALTAPTKGRPIPVSAIMETMQNLSAMSLSKQQLELAQATALFAYYTSITGKRHATTMWTKERFTRLRDHLRQRGMDFCLYVVDGGVHHPDLNQPDKGKKYWDLDSFFPLNNAGRLEKLVEITAYGRKRHPILVKHPELLGEEGRDG